MLSRRRPMLQLFYTVLECRSAYSHCPYDPYNCTDNWHYRRIIVLCGINHRIILYNIIFKYLPYIIVTCARLRLVCCTAAHTHTHIHTVCNNIVNGILATFIYHKSQWFFFILFLSYINWVSSVYSCIPAQLCSIPSQTTRLLP